MLNTFVPSTNPATLLVASGGRPMLIVNADQVDTLWLGESNDVLPGNNDSVPISPNGFLAVDGNEDIYAIGDPASVDNGVFVYVIPGGMSFFQLFSQLVIQGTNAGIFIYSPAPANGTLIGSWSAIEGTDFFGNPFPAGINVLSGLLSGVGINQATIDAANILDSILQTCSLINPSISGGTMIETTIVMDTSGGRALGYATTTTTFTLGPADISWTSPITGTALVQCWGADAGGGGGNSTGGGEAGGGGAYAESTAYPVVAGQVYDTQIGLGGNGGSTNSAGTFGGDTVFDDTGVSAGGGLNGSGGGGGHGGFFQAGDFGFSGGNGGSNPSNFNASAGGGGRAGSTGPGGNGFNPSGNASPGAAGAAGPGTGGHVGGAGVLSGTNGLSGGGGSGAGNASGGATITKTYNANSSRSWFGADANSPNGTRVTNGLMYQGGESAGGGAFNGTQKAACLFPTNSIQSDFAGATMSSATFSITNQHSWYNSGLSVQVKSWPNSLGSSLPGSWNGLGAPVITTQTQGEGTRKKFSLGSSVASAFKNGATVGIAIGPGPGSLNLSYYGYFTGTPNSSSGPQLTLVGTTGVGQKNAGDGQDGVMKITVASTTTLNFALSPIAGADGNGNAYAAGYTGPTTAFVPGSSPTIAETVHDMPAMSNSWSVGAGGEAKYKLDSSGALQFSFVLNSPGTKTDGITIWAAGSLPVGYRPSVAKRWPISTGTNALSANNTPSITFGTDGSITMTGVNTSGTLSHVDAHGVMPLF